jgi:hypothetical protein
MSGIRKGEQFGPHGFRHGGFGIIDQEIITTGRKMREPVRMQGKQIVYFD